MVRTRMNDVDVEVVGEELREILGGWFRDPMEWPVTSLEDVRKKVVEDARRLIPRGLARQPQTRRVDPSMA